MTNFSTLKERIMQFIDYKGLSKNKFYIETGLSNGILDKKSGLSMDSVEKILEKYPDININWLIRGEGTMIKGFNYTTEEAPSPLMKEANTEYTKPKKDKKGIPLIHIDAMAGIATGEITIHEHECDRYVVPMFKGADFLITVKGSSMIPKYNSGDIVACKIVPLQDIFFQWNKVYVLDTVQGALIKRVKKGSDKDHILCVSENEKYEPFELHLKHLNAVSIVMGVIRLE